MVDQGPRAYLPLHLLSVTSEGRPGAPPPAPSHAPSGYAPDPYAPGPGPAPGPAPGAAPQTSGKAVAALILGIVGICIGWIPVVGIIGFITGILAIVLGVLAKKEIDASNGRITGSGMAVAGIVLGVIQLAIILLVLLFLSAAISDFQQEFEDASQIIRFYW